MDEIINKEIADDKRVTDALLALASMISRSEKAQGKFAPGTSQHTLQKNRIHALRVAASLLDQQLHGHSNTGQYVMADLERAAAPIASLISKSEKAQEKLKEGSWQHIMLKDNLKALHLASGLLEDALNQSNTFGSCSASKNNTHPSP